MRPAAPLPARQVEPRAGPAPFEELLGALALEGIEFAVLRDAEPRAAAEGGSGSGDRSGARGPVEIDLLVAPRDVDRLAAVLRGRGYAETAAPGHAPHRFFVRFDADTDTWYKVDAVTALRYGSPIRSTEVGDVAAVLRRRGAGAGLAPEDEFAALLLHCLLDHGRVEPRHAARLRELRSLLATLPDAEAEARRRLEVALAPEPGWDRLVSAVDGDRWHELLARREEVARRLFWRDPIPTIGRWWAGRVLRRLRPVIPRRPGLVVALLGPDGAGKTTLARSLVAERPLDARRVYMGGNPEAANVRVPGVSGFARRPPPGAGGPARALRRAGSYGARLIDRWYRYAVARYHRRRGRTVLLDRTVRDARTPAPPAGPGRRLRRRLLRAGAPRPDLIIVLDAPAPLLLARKGEHTVERLRRMRCRYRRLARTDPRAVVIDATSPPAEVRRRALAVIASRRAGVRPEAARNVGSRR